ncbi:MAG: hypothetical protein ACK4IC_06230 [Erythrobacter sp.]
MSTIYFLQHDLWVAIALAALWLGCQQWTPALGLPHRAPALTPVLIVAGVLAGLTWAGAYLVMSDYPLTRDEHMATFDGAIFASGRLAERLPTEWAGFGRALVPAFLMETQGDALLVSAYLPVNAAARGLFGLIGDPALMNPLLAAIGLVLLWRIARNLLSDSPAAQWLVLGGYAVSAQVLLTAMTPYAMTGHLVLNLLWLALLLRDKWWSHLLAMVVGVLAMGLHQFVFHPLFAAPFVLWLLLKRRWLLVAGYGAAYGAGLVLWLAWPGIVADWAGLPAAARAPTTLAGVVESRILPLVTRIDPHTLPLMLSNLLRLVTWNAAFLLPLLLALGPALKRRDCVVLALLGGVVLTIAAMAILLPYQGHGWGYRYLHGLIGSLCLLAGFGYREIAAREAVRSDGAALAMLAASGLVIVPVALWWAQGFVRPHAALHKIISQTDADFVIVDDLAYPDAVDEVRNRADLSNRPLVFSRKYLGDDRIALLCARGTVAVAGAHTLAAAGMLAEPPAGTRPLAPPCCCAADD